MNSEQEEQHHTNLYVNTLTSLTGPDDGLELVITALEHTSHTFYISWEETSPSGG